MFSGSGSERLFRGLDQHISTFPKQRRDGLPAFDTDGQEKIVQKGTFLSASGGNILCSIVQWLRLNQQGALAKAKCHLIGKSSLLHKMIKRVGHCSCHFAKRNIGRSIPEERFDHIWAEVKYTSVKGRKRQEILQIRFHSEGEIGVDL